MNKLQKILDLTCQECFSVYQLLEIHEQVKSWNQNCSRNCFTQWQKLLHQHFQEQIILFLAQQEANKDHDQNNPDHDSK